MTKEDALSLTHKTFTSIREAKSCAELREIKLGEGENFNETTYPKIEFSISKEEIETLRRDKILGEDNYFSKDISSKIKDPLTKILFATVWKNGDLQKIKHIIQGIVDQGSEKNDQESALVFYQFGKHLTKQLGEPIVDQHVIRAFAVYKPLDNEDRYKLLKLATLNKNHVKYINRYKEWLISDEINSELKTDPNYCYEIDKVLFALGKAIKFQKSDL